MRTIRIAIDDELLSRLDADEEVRRDGRSAVLRRAVLEYLQGKRRERIAEAYERACGAGVRDPELEGWESEGAWSDE